MAIGPVDTNKINQGATSRYRELLAKAPATTTETGETQAPTGLTRDAFLGEAKNEKNTRQYSDADFKRYDKDGSGQISEDEFKKGYLMDRVTENVSKGFIEQMMNQIGTGLTDLLKRR